jgi:hypothetical protein
MSREFEPKVFVILNSPPLAMLPARSSVLAAFAQEGDAARFVNEHPWKDILHLEDRVGNKISSIWSHADYSHASAFLKNGKTYYGSATDESARDQARAHNWVIHDYERDDNDS